jgi:ketosteroid isomerase-like protein
MPTAIEIESIQTYQRFVAMRDEIDAGGRPWSALAEFFTEDAVYCDPAWGRIEGREAIADFFVRAMAGLTGHGWSTPENWTMAAGHRLVSQWDQVLGKGADGEVRKVPGLSILYYAGDDLFCYSHDFLNMVEINACLREMNWNPPAELNAPPQKPNRDVSLPAAWAYLANESHPAASAAPLT